MVPASVYLGFTAAIIWVGKVIILISNKLFIFISLRLTYIPFTMQGTYLTSAALSHARDNNLPDGPAVGRFNGEFWGVFASTQVQKRCEKQTISSRS